MRKIILFGFLLLVAGCRNSDISHPASFALDDFEQVDLRVEDAESLMCDNLFLGNPMSMACHPEGFLLIRERGVGKQLTIVDVVNKICTEAISCGRAENELLGAWDIAVFDSDVYVSSLNDKKLIKLGYDSEGRHFDYEKSFYFPDSFFRCIPVDGGFLTFASSISSSRFHRWDKDAQALDTLGTFPSYGIESSVPLDNGMLQSAIAVSPDGRSFVTAYMGVDYIDIYRDMDLSARLRGPDSFDVSVRQKEAGNGHIFSYLVPDITAYTHAVAGEDGFWLGYSGYKLEKDKMPSPDDMKTKIIFSFSWDGTPCKAYMLDRPVDAFAIDKKAGLLYCLTGNPEWEIKILDFK